MVILDVVHFDDQLVFRYILPERSVRLFVNKLDVKTSTFSKSIVSHVSVPDAFTGFNKSLKYSLHRERISFSSLRMFPVES